MVIHIQIFSIVDKLCVGALVLALILTFSSTNALAQNYESGPGLQLGGITNVTHSPTHRADNFVTRIFYRNQFTPVLYGEASLGIGKINATDYSTRIFPAEYRLQYFPYQFRSTDALSLNIDIQPFIYTGVGAHFYNPVAIPAADDPLVEEMGPVQPVSSFWGYEAGVAPSASVGIGTDLRLSPEIGIVINAGYNQTFTKNMTGVDNGDLDGYWGISVGMQFNRPQPEMPAPRMTVAEAPEVRPEPSGIQIPAIAAAGQMPVIHFDILQNSLTDYEAEVDLIASYIQSNPGRPVTIHGHTDQVGMDRVNETLAQDRAFVMAMELINKGVDPGQLYIAAHAGNLPRINAEKSMHNRRVDVQWEQNGEPVLYEDVSSSFDKPEWPLTDNKIRFAWASGQLQSDSEVAVHSLMAYLKENQEASVGLFQQLEPNKSEQLHDYLVGARHRNLQRIAIGYGVEPERIQLINTRKLEKHFPEVIDELGDGQANVVIEL